MGYRAKVCATLCGAAIVIGGASAAGATTVIYSGVFPGASTAFLSGQVPTQQDNSGGEIGSTTNAWTAQTTGTNQWMADGSVNTNSTNKTSSYAYLPFVPAAGNLYTLSATLNDTNAANTRWMAIGFTQSTATAGRWVDATGAIASAWLLHRGSFTGGSFDQAYLGPSPASGAVGQPDNGAAPNIAAAANGTVSGAVNVQITLNTSTPLWSVTWAEEDPNNLSAGYIVGRTATYAANPTINDVGLMALDQITGGISNYQLTSTPAPTPEPACIGLAVVAVGALGRRKRRS